MKFKRTDEYTQKLFEQALFDEKHVFTDANVTILQIGGKLKAYCDKSDTFLQFPKHLRDYHGQRYIADVVEILRSDNVTKYYRAMKGSIRIPNSDEVLG